jgi:hypothetical protein
MLVANFQGRDPRSRDERSTALPPAAALLAETHLLGKL